MESDASLRDEKITLKPCTNELWHEFYKNYIVDPMMDTTPYAYDYERIEKAYRIKTTEESRRYFFITHGDKIIGQIYLKHMDEGNKTTEFGIALTDDSVKGKGFGTEAIRLLIDYAFNVLDMESIAADSVLRNTRSQHVLEKTGFRYIHEDSDFKYYVLRRVENQ